MKQLGTEEFNNLMQTIAQAWTDGLVEKAADHYTELALFQFCGAKRPRPPIRIVWHHLTFDEKEQAGMGRYTYQQIGIGYCTAQVIRGYRAVAWIQVEDGKISQWREFRS
jgi:hypothetical protein